MRIFFIDFGGRLRVNSFFLRVLFVVIIGRLFNFFSDSGYCYMVVLYFRNSFKSSRVIVAFFLVSGVVGRGVRG